MPKYKVTKVLRLSIVVEAADESEAEDISINTDELDMHLDDCQYEVLEEVPDDDAD